MDTTHHRLYYSERAGPARRPASALVAAADTCNISLVEERLAARTSQRRDFGAGRLDADAESDSFDVLGRTTARLEPWMAARLAEIPARAEAGTPILDPSAGLGAAAREALEGGAPAAVRRAGGGLSGSEEPRAKAGPAAASSAAGGDSLTASSPANMAGADGASSTEVSQVCTSRCWCDGC